MRPVIGVFFLTEEEDIMLCGSDNRLHSDSSIVAYCHICHTTNPFQTDHHFGLFLEDSFDVVMVKTRARQTDNLSLSNRPFE